MKVDEKTKKAKAYMQRLVKKMESDRRGSLSYAEKQELGMFNELRAGLHIGQKYPQWHEWDDKKKTETLKALPVKELTNTLSYEDDNQVPLLFALPTDVRVELLEKMTKAGLIFEPLQLMQQKNRYGESLLEVTSYDKVYGPRMGMLFSEVKEKGAHCKLVHNVQQKLKKKKEQDEKQAEVKLLRKDQYSR